MIDIEINKSGREMEDKLIDLLQEFTEKDWWYVKKNYADKGLKDNENFLNIKIISNVIYFVYLYLPRGSVTLARTHSAISLIDLLNEKMPKTAVNFRDYLYTKFGDRFRLLVLQNEKIFVDESLAAFTNVVGDLRDRLNITLANKEAFTVRKRELDEFSSMDSVIADEIKFVEESLVGYNGHIEDLRGRIAQTKNGMSHYLKRKKVLEEEIASIKSNIASA